MTEKLICQRCTQNEASVISRKETFCDDCFKKFVTLKERKQLMSDSYYQDIFKVMYQDKIRNAQEAALQNEQSKILVPLSFGSSSLVMLDIINDSLSEQKRTHRGITGFSVHVITVFRDENALQPIKKYIKELSEVRYSANKDKITFHVIDINSFCNSSEELRAMVLHSIDFKTHSINSEDQSLLSFADYSIKNLLEQCPNRSSKEDLLSFVIKHVIKKFAFQNDFKAILWGNSMTKVADEIISLVVKGRGASIAASLNTTDFDRDYENKFKNLYPMKDILLSEIDAYCHIFNLYPFMMDYKIQDTLLLSKFPKQELVQTSKLVKNMTMNELARKYFDDIETNYSNVISTVVRTGEKLAEPKLGEEFINKKCRVCQHCIHYDPSFWLSSITETLGHPLESEDDIYNFKNWEAYMKKTANSSSGVSIKLKKFIENNGDETTLCYGCIVTLNGIKDRTLIWPNHNDVELNKVLNEYILTDDEDELGGI